MPGRLNCKCWQEAIARKGGRKGLNDQEGKGGARAEYKGRAPYKGGTEEGKHGKGHTEVSFWSKGKGYDKGKALRTSSGLPISRLWAEAPGEVEKEDELEEAVSQR